MNKPKFTPGPWEVVYRDDESFMSMALIAPKGLMNPDNMGRLIDEPTEIQEKVIAITHHQLAPMAGYEACEKDEEEGNAGLMAAAPEMYEALNEIMEQLELMPLSEHVLSAISIYERAIFKAQGGES
ncbi:MAG: hypothetical protein WA125_16735 [Desulfosporosinus sp.]